MIAAVKGWHAVVSALLFFIPRMARPADDLPAAARELARKTSALAGKFEPVSVSWRNASSLGSSEFAEARTAFEAALEEAATSLTEAAPTAEARMTLSENQAQFLLVEEIRKGEEQHVWIAAWTRSAPPTPDRNGPALEKKLVWEQEEPILDVAFPQGGMLVLSPTRLAWVTERGGRWDLSASVAITAVKSWPRDPRGRLRLGGGAFKAYLPGAECNGSLEPALVLECRAADEPWVLESGRLAMLLASLAPGRNYFEGGVTTQTGVRKDVPPFYSAASVDEYGRGLWLLATVDGRTQIFDPSFEAVATIGNWGSDIAGLDNRCGGPPAVLATRPVDSDTPDAIQAFSIVKRSAVPLTGPVELPGPVLALWPSGGTGAVAVARNLASGRYEAYLLGLACGS